MDIGPTLIILARIKYGEIEPVKLISDLRKMWSISTVTAEKYTMVR